MEAWKYENIQMSLYLSHIYLNLVVWKCESVKIWKYGNEPLPYSSKSRKVGLLVIFLLMLLLRMIVVVTLIVTVELLLVGNDSAAPSGCRESLPENKINVTLI